MSEQMKFEDSSRLSVRLNWLEKKTWKRRGLRIATICGVVAFMCVCVLPMAAAKEKDKEAGASLAKTGGEKKQEEVSSGDETGSRAWYVMRQLNAGPMLLGLTQQLGKVIVPSQRDGKIWKGVRRGRKLKLKIMVEGDASGEIFVGFFSDATWSAEPVQVRSFPGPGEYVVEKLPAGKFQIGAMIGTPPVADALGVHRTWPEPIEVKRGKTAAAKVLVSADFQQRASGWYNQEVSRGFIGEWDKMNPDNLLQGRVTGPGGRPIAYAQIMIREYKANPKRGIAAPETGSDEKGHFFFDGMRWPYRVGARWHEMLPHVLGHRSQTILRNRVFEGPQAVNFQFNAFPTGNAAIKGRVVDQNGNPVPEFHLWLVGPVGWEKKPWDGKSKEDIKYIHYSVPFISEDGSFELSGLPAGVFEARAVPFNARAYKTRDGTEVELEEGKTTEAEVRVTAKNILYGRVLFEDGKAPAADEIYIVLMMRGRGRGVGSVDSEGYFSIHLSDGELEAVEGGRFTIGIMRKDNRQQLGRFPARLLSAERSKAGVLKIQRPKEGEARAGKDGRKMQDEISGDDKVVSRAWYVMRQLNAGPMLLGLTQQLGKVGVPSQRDGKIWKGMEKGGKLKLKIMVEGDVSGEIFVGFFKDGKWSGEPVQVRSFPGPGEYVVEKLPAGKFQIGAMIGAPPVADALGVHRTWPEPVEIKRGMAATAVEVLVSEDFQEHASGWYNQEVSRGFIGEWEKMNQTNLLQGRVTGPDGEPIAYAQIVLHEYKGKRSSYKMLHSGTDGEGYFYLDKMDWPYRVQVIWDEKLPEVLGTRQHYIIKRRVFKGRQTVNFKFDDFSPGTAVLKGRVVDQGNKPVREFHLFVQTKIDWSDWHKDTEGDYRVTSYQIPFISEDGSFELSGLPSGVFVAMAVPFDVQAYERNKGVEVELKEGTTTESEVRLKAKNVLHGRVLFEDGKTPAADEIRIVVTMGRGGRGRVVGSVDSDGYFTVHFSDRELEAVKAGWSTILMIRKDSRQRLGTFPAGLLSAERSKAGVLKVPRVPPKEPKKFAPSGKEVKPFELLGIDGKTYRLDDYKGKVVLLNIFATWCRPCFVELPHLRELNSRFADKGLVILAISRMERTKTVEAYARRWGLSYPVLLDRTGRATDQFADKWGRISLPTNVLLDREHKIVHQLAGFSKRSFTRLEEVIEEVLDGTWGASKQASFRIPFKGVASGGELVLADTLNRNTRSLGITTVGGESAEVVASRLADAINVLNESAASDSKKRAFWAGGGKVKASRGAIRLPGGGYIFAGTERGLGIPEPPLSLSCSYDLERDEVALRWVNPVGGYDSIHVLLNWSNYDHRGGDSVGGTATSFVIDRKKRPVDVKDLDVWVIGYRDNIPSNAAAIHLSGNSQEELYGIPFSNNVAPNWRAWVMGGEPDTVEFGQGTRREFLHLEGKRYNPIRRAATKPFYQVIKTKSANVRGGVFRKFLGLKPGHTYRISGRLNTFEMDSAKGDWTLSLHAAYNLPGGPDLRVEQLSGLVALPDGSKGPAAGRIASYGPKVTTKQRWEEKVAAVVLPAGLDTITVWVRHSGADSTGVGIDWVKLEDLSAVKPK